MLSCDTFFFMSPYRSFTTSGCFRRFSCPAVDGESLNGHFQQQLRVTFNDAKAAGIRKPIVVGAIPFDTTQPSALFVPLSRYPFRQAGKQHSAGDLGDRKTMNVIERREIPGRDRFESMVARAAALTATPEVDKVVLSRLIEITTGESVDCGALLQRLIAQNPTSYNFQVPLSDSGVLLGASPELLLRKEGNSFSSLPLAGSASRQSDDIQDRDAGRRLLASKKDRHEHQLVTQAMKQVLTPRSESLTLPSSPQLITTPTLWHLATPISGIAPARETALSLACLLHPTPALSGFPHQVAKRVISELEPFERELFGGLVGWCDEEGNGEWVVAIRCAKLKGNSIRLFAGAGIVPDSLPEAEWRETGTKLSTMLRVFGLL